MDLAQRELTLKIVALLLLQQVFAYVRFALSFFPILAFVPFQRHHHFHTGEQPKTRGTRLLISASAFFFFFEETPHLQILTCFSHPLFG